MKIKKQVGTILSNEKGMVLPVGLMFLAIIAILGTTAVIITTTDLKIGTNYKLSEQAFYAAEAGIEEARARLRGPSTVANYAGDPSAAYDPWWSAYILTSSSWQPSDDSDYNANYKNYIPTPVSHTNTTITTNSLQTNILYFVKIRHKKEYDAEQAGHTISSKHYHDGDGDTGANSASTPGNIIYYGYKDDTSTTIEQFTTTVANPPNASPVQIITSHGMRGESLKVIKIESGRELGPPIVSALYGDTVGGNGTVSVVGDDNCDPTNSLPAVAYCTDDLLSVGGDVTLTSIAGATTKLSSPIDIAQHVENLTSEATVILKTNQTKYSVGSSSVYEIVYCDATGLTDSQLKLTNLTGYGTLVVKGDLYFSGNLNWHGLILASGNVDFFGGGSDVKNVTGAVLANSTATLQGKVNITYDSCEVANAQNNYSQTTLIWKESLN
ncbi:MAG: pilus assembly PilX N-terminal domain-containing protein [Deltaproteobacteria bacterium]|jgi:Tfp pilus assembly protein PilX|nr:pilus assembly PilX N-terminal domain-containing protein [Deltaproteobacteria bacterium]MDL1986064.1 pilus assembly PilX N-terminal domain-containing protein [Deltaproteobacteria bacterium]